MNAMRRGLAVLVAACGFTVWAGCGEGKPAVTTSMEETTVKGKVTIKGKAVNGGEVVFDASNYQRKGIMPKSAPIKEGGVYEVKTLVGSNKIRLGGAAVKGNPIAAHQSWDLDAKPGENTFDINVTVVGPAK